MASSSKLPFELPPPCDPPFAMPLAFDWPASRSRAPSSSGLAVPRSDLSINPDIRWLSDHSLVARDPRTEIEFPYSLEGDVLHWTKVAARGQNGSPDLSAAAFSALEEAKILVAKPTQDNEHETAHLRQTLRERDHCFVGNIFNAFQIESLGCYIRELDRRKLFKEERSLPGRRAIHNNIVMSYYHRQFTCMMSKIAGEPLKPSYCYTVIYNRGTALAKHCDRDQCRWNVSILIDSAPAPSREREFWPIYLETKEGDIGVDLRFGDGIIFSGRRVPHWRKPLSSAEWAALVFFHYVPETFAGRLD